MFIPRIKISRYINRSKNTRTIHSMVFKYKMREKKLKKRYNTLVNYIANTIFLISPAKNGYKVLC